MQDKINKVESLATIAAFLLAVLWPSYLWLSSEEQMASASEKRALAPRPIWSWERGVLNTFPGQFEAYYNDHFGPRPWALPYYQRLRYETFGISPSDEVLVGSQGFLYLTEGTREFEPLDQVELQGWERELKQRQAFLSKLGIAYMLVVVPDKTDIYPEHLPEQVRRTKQQSRIDQFCDEMRTRTEVPIVNLRQRLLGAKEANELYFRNDPHWNSLGAYLGASEIIQQLSGNFSELALPAWEHFGISKRGFSGGGLARMMGLTKDLRERSFKLARNQFDGCASTFAITQPPEASFVTECRSGTQRVLMFRDSYASALAPFLSEVFQRICYLWMRPSFADFKSEVRREMPDLVIEQRVSRFLNAEFTRK